AVRGTAADSPLPGRQDGGSRDPARMNILICDDEEVLQDVLTQLVRREGHATLSARSGEEALEILEREEVDLVLLDLMLPGLSGQQVLREIRQRDADQVVVVIAAYSSVE